MAIDVKPVTADSPIMKKLHKHKSVYTPSFPVRGLALLIINVEFTDSKLRNRDGAQHDIDNLSGLYYKLGYNVKVLRDATRQSIITEFDKIRLNRELANYGSFVMGLSTHGEGNSYLCADGTRLYLREIVDYFDSVHCPLLAGKPKFLFFDASSGLTRDRGVAMDKSLLPPKVPLSGEDPYKATQLSLSNLRIGEISRPKVDIQSLQSVNIMKNGNGLSQIPEKSDFIIATSTYDSYVSWRRSTHGCWFSRVMVEVFQQYACDHHIAELLKLIRRKLTQVETKHGYKQVSVTTDSLLKRFYFFPGVEAL